MRHAKDLPGERVLDAVAARRPGLSRDAALRAEAARNVSTYSRRDPLGFARMLAGKPLRLWLTPSPRDDSLRTPALRVWHAAVVVFALVGLLRLRDWRVIAALGAFTVFHLAVPALPRYALPILPVLIAAGCAGWLAPRTRRAPPGSRASRVPRPARPASPSRSA